MALFRVFDGPVRRFDEPAARAMLDLALSRTTDPASSSNHNRVAWRDDPRLMTTLSSITAPTSIVHGD